MSIVSRGDTYTTLQSTNSSRTFKFMDLISNQSFVIKFKLYGTDFSNMWIAWVFTSTATQTNSFSFYNLTASGDVEITVNGNAVTTKLNGTTVKTNTLNRDLSEQVRMAFMNNANDIKISDLEVYPI